MRTFRQPHAAFRPRSTDSIRQKGERSNAPTHSFLESPRTSSPLARIAAAGRPAMLPHRRGLGNAYYYNAT